MTKRTPLYAVLGTLIALSLPACATTPVPYDCAAPPTLSGVVKVKNAIPNRYIVVLKRTAGEGAQAAAAATALAARFPQARNVSAFRGAALSGFSATMERRAAEDIAKDPQVAYVQEEGRKTIGQMVACADLTRAGFINGDISTVMSPRTVMTWAENARIFGDVGFGFRLTFLNKCDEVERATVAEYFQRCFGQELKETGVKAKLV